MLTFLPVGVELWCFLYHEVHTAWFAPFQSLVLPGLPSHVLGGGKGHRRCCPALPSVRHMARSRLLCSRSIGYRFGKHLPATIPLVIKFSHDAVEGDDELREHCLQALEAFVQHSPHEARPNVHHIFDTSLQFLNYDPNYADNMDEDEEEDQDMEEDDE